MNELKEKKNSKKSESEDEDKDEERDHHKPRPPQLTIHYSGNMELLFLKFYNEKDYECEVVVRDEALKELRLTLDEALHVYRNRERRFGQSSAQIQAAAEVTPADQSVKAA